jgi:hypothetical protein
MPAFFAAVPIGSNLPCLLNARPQKPNAQLRKSSSRPDKNRFVPVDKWRQKHLTSPDVAIIGFFFFRHKDNPVRVPLPSTLFIGKKAVDHTFFLSSQADILGPVKEHNKLDYIGFYQISVFCPEALGHLRADWQLIRKS